jgi:hypothetical protein
MDGMSRKISARSSFSLRRIDRKTLTLASIERDQIVSSFVPRNSVDAPFSFINQTVKHHLLVSDWLEQRKTHPSSRSICVWFFASSVSKLATRSMKKKTASDALQPLQLL